MVEGYGAYRKAPIAREAARTGNSASDTNISQKLGCTYSNVILRAALLTEETRKWRAASTIVAY